MIYEYLIIILRSLIYMKYKNILFIIPLIVGFFCVTECVNMQKCSKNFFSAVSVQKKNCDLMNIYIFDLHGVIVHANMKDIVHCVKHSFFRSFSSAFKTLKVWSKIGYHTLFKCPSMRGKSLEACIIDYINKNLDDMWILDEFVQLANFQKVDPDMLQLLKDLKSNGSKLILASNIGERAFEYAQKHCKELKSLFSLFDVFVIAKPSSNGVYIAKPDSAFYDKIWEAIKTVSKDTVQNNILFIDDSKKNIIAAEKADIPSYIFTNYKNLKLYLEEQVKKYQNCSSK